MTEDEELDSMINDLVQLGALRLSSKDRYGEKIYYVNPERMQEVFPEYYEIFIQEVNETLIGLVKDGLVSIEYDENLNAKFSLSEEGQMVVDEMIISDRIDEV